MAIQYADTSALSDYSPNLDHPDDVVAYLRAASRLVSRATRLARYEAQPSGLPTDSDLIGALSDAVCEQVTAWTRAGVDPQRGQVFDAVEAGELKSSTVTAGPRTVTEQYTDAAGESQTETPSTTELTPAAWMILFDAGLLGAQPVAVRGW